MKTHINAALTLLNELHQSGHIRDEGNVKFQAAKGELEAALAMPDPGAAEPVVIESPDMQALNGNLADISAKLDTIQTLVTPAPAQA